MNQRELFKKTIAWTLITAMANPAAMAPAFARDTDIFLATTTGATTAEPNIMIVLDTSDSMNIPEPWHEIATAEMANPGNPDDPVNYDSHYEYLWNDTTFIYSIGCNVPSCGGGGDQYTNAGKNLAKPADYDTAMLTMPQGYFAGVDTAARGTLKQSAITWAGTTYAGDPGARSTYRDYDNANWVWWLPAGTAETDLRLMSNTFSRAALGSRITYFSNANGTSNPVSRGGINYGNSSDFAQGNFNFTTLAYQQSGAQNRCTSSYASLLPSTVYAPGPYAKNTGKWTGQQWVRYERWLALDSSRVASDFPSIYAGDIAKAKWVNDAAFPSTPNYDPANYTGTNPFTANARDNSYYPIRIQNGASSYAGWTDLRTDMGGQNYAGYMFGFGDASATLVNILAAYGITSNQKQARVRAAVRTGELGAHTSTIAGCTDAASCQLVGVSLGVPAYFDVTGTATDPGAPPPPPTTCQFVSTAPDTCVGPDANGVYTGCTIKTLAANGTQDGPDAKNNNRRWLDATTTSFRKTAGPAGTGCALSGGSNSWSPNDNRDSAWTGRQTTVVEGTTYYNGGTCQGRCSYATGQIAQCPVGAAASPGPSFQSSYQPAPQYSTKGAVSPPIQYFASLVVGGNTLYDVITGGAATAATGCVDNSDVAAQNCNGRNGGNCLGNNYEIGLTVTGTPPPPTVPVFNTSGTEANLNHECLADNNTTGNPSSSWVIKNNRTWNTSYNTSVSAGASSPTASYTNSASYNYDTVPAKNVDMYAVNYLNWKYGPRGPNGRQIGRKTRLQIAKDALVNLVQNTNGVRFGLATFNSLPNDITKRAAEGSQGARVVYQITRMGSNPTDTPDYNNRAILGTRLLAQQAKAATPLTEAMYEAMLYFAGRTPRFGTNAMINANFGATSLAALGGGNVADGNDANAICTAVGPQCTAIGDYKSPMMNNPNTTNPATCQKNFVVMITDGGPDRDKDANTQIQNTFHPGALGTVSARTTVDAAQPDTTTDQFETAPGVPFGPISSADIAYSGGYIWLDELTYFMSRADLSPGASIFVGDTGTDALLAGRQGAITYTVGFAGGSSAVLSNAAARAGGNYYEAQDSAQLEAVLSDAIVSIVNWNPTIAAPSVPISALNRTENATDIYLAFFQPDPSQAWKGTLKKYALGTTEAECGDGVQLCLTGQTVLANPITCGTQGGGNCKNIEEVEVDPVTGATTKVVHDQTISFWNPLGVIDGSDPAQGGSGYQLLNTGGYNPSTRNVYTFLTNGVSSSTALTNATNLVRDTNALINTATVITGTGSDAERSKLINFVLGGDPAVGVCTDASTALTACTAWRSWAHSDIQHSKPVIVTYDATTVPPVQYVFYTSNDGLLHAVDANTGQEKWAFLIEDAYSKLTAMFNDNAGASLDVADGQISVWIYDDLGDGKIETAADKAHLFFGLRRGGSAYYALDVSSRDAPVFKWKIAGGGSGAGKVCVGSSACAAVANYDELGQTWSAATVGKVRAPGGAGTVALIFGGGYDPAEDSIPRGVRTMGRAVFVAEAENPGNIINSWGVGQAGAYRAGSGTMAYAIPSDVTALNTDIDAQGFIDRLYVGDLGGNVWRMDVNNPTATAWLAKQLASLSEATGESRKFMFAPAAVKQNSPERFDAVYIGSGDREHPLTTSTSLPANANLDKMFMIKDDYQLEATAGAPFTLASLLDRPEGDTAQLTDADIANPVKGWIVGLQDGEKVINAPTVFFNRLRFGTYAPLAQSNACAPPGESRLNEIDALTGNFFDLDSSESYTSTDRYYGSTSTGYISTGQIIVLGNNIYHIVASPLLQSQLIGTIGSATKIYWYMEPEQ
ncbi:MAG: hypothetical protein HY525_10140 [Betaproteobacteria bacterium]|nr:hypothetical protein [Betaproteobacteria bacterium]